MPVPALGDILVDFTEQLVPLVQELVLSCALGGLAEMTRAVLAALVGHYLNFSASPVVIATTRSPVLSALQLLEAKLSLDIHLLSHAFVLVVEALAVRGMPHELLLKVLDWDLVVRLHDTRQYLCLLLHQLLFLLAEVDGFLARRMSKGIARAWLARLPGQSLDHEGNLLGTRGQILVPVDGFALHVELHLGLYAVRLDEVLPVVLNDLLLELLLAHACAQLWGLGWRQRVLVVHHVGRRGLQRRLHAGLALLFLLEVLAKQLVLAYSVESLVGSRIAVALLGEQAV